MAGSARTCCACRRTPCRTRLPRPRIHGPCPRVRTRRNPRPHHRSGTRAHGLPLAAGRSGWSWSWSCRAYRQRPACRAPAARSRPATAHLTCTCGLRPAPPRPRRCRVTAHCPPRFHRSQAKYSAAGNPARREHRGFPAAWTWADRWPGHCLRPHAQAHAPTRQRRP